MTVQGLLALAWQSVTAPADVARLLLALRLNREAVLTAFGVVVIANALVFSLSQLIDPAPPELATVLSSPVAFALLLAGSMVAMILAITWTGTAMGHPGRFEDVALLITWLQALRVFVQLALLVVLPLSTGLAGLVALAASALGLYILVMFTATAHDTGPGRAVVIVVLGTLGMAIGLTLLLSLLGVSPQGLT